MIITSAELLDVILAQVQTLEGEAFSAMDIQDFGELKLKSLRMDSLSLLELGMEVSTAIGREVDFVEMSADLTMREIADRLSSGN